MKFSVSMSVYKNDNPDFFRQAIDSIINQTVPPSEIIMVVDGPVPESITSIVSEYEAGFNNFTSVRLEKNVGHGNARRTGLENCTYNLIALMDSDDISVPDRFEKQLKCFEEDPELSIVGGHIYEFIGDVDNVVGIRSVSLTDDRIKKNMKVQCPMNQMTVMFKKSEVQKAGGYLDWHYNEDYYLWIRMSLQGCKFRNLLENLCFVRVGNEVYKRRGGRKYFKSEKRIQELMFKKGIIGPIRFLINVTIRFVVQVLLPNYIRGIIFRKLFRKRKVSYSTNT